MNINWYGQTCFKIISQKSKDGQVLILIDPATKGAGFKGPKIEADIILFTNPEDAVSGSHFSIDGSGEYEIKEVYVKGYSIPSRAIPQNVVYSMTIEDVKICHLGKIDHDELTTQELEEIGDVDILMIPIGGKDSLDAKAAIKIMSQIEPKITIPMYYRTAKIKEKLDGLDVFLKALGVKNLLPLPKLSIKKKDISEEDAKVVALEC